MLATPDPGVEKAAKYKSEQSKEDDPQIRKTIE
jgi:hypothetical protein